MDVGDYEARLGVRLATLVTTRNKLLGGDGARVGPVKREEDGLEGLASLVREPERDVVDVVASHGSWARS
jgi:hypothetical protein